MNLNIPKINFNIPNQIFRGAKYNYQSPSFKSDDSKGDTFELSIGYINDTHGQVNNMMRILSGLKGDIKLSAGDNDIGDEKNKAIHHATAKFLNLADIKASAFGNHELDTTQSDFMDTLKFMKTKILAINFNKEENWEKRNDIQPEYGRAGLDKAIDSSMITTVKGEKIGLIGTCPLDMFARTTHPNYHKDCYVNDLEDTIELIQKEIEKIKEQGVNKIILLSHLGHSNDIAVAQKTEGIDVIISGHTHELFKDIKEGENLFYSKTGEPVIITEAGRDGAYFGQLNLTFDKNGVIKKAQNNVGEARNFHKNMVNQYIFDEILGKPEDIGFIKQAPPPPTKLIEENPHANFVCDAMKHITNSDIALWNNAGIRNFFHEGNIDSRDIKDIAPFLDRICVAYISEKALVDLFKGAIEDTYENAEKGYKPGLLAVSGLKYGVDEKEGELTFLTYIDKNGNEQSIDIENPREDKKYKMVTDEFVMSAGADFPVIAELQDCLKIYPYDKDVMTCEYIKYLDKPIVINQSGRIIFENRED